VSGLQRAVNRYGIYLEELRRKLVLITKIFAISFIVGFFATSPAIKLMIKYLKIQGVTLVTTSPFQIIELAMSVGFFVACIITVPIFVYHFYRFIRSGLLAKERRALALSVPMALVLFSIGFLYGCGMLYYGVKMIAKTNVTLGVANYWDISLFISQILLTSSLLGVLFLFPLIITFLIKLGVLTVRFLKSKRRHAIVVIFIIVSLLPPTDGLSLILMAVPLILIFELTILFNRDKHRRLVN
jgi:sec-independent protein translocase protein TatC